MENEKKDCVLEGHTGSLGKRSFIRIMKPEHPKCAHILRAGLS